uniref:37S ribosomal protein S22, mitochondrial n=1 Tax=Nicotiana tabacum TaxID=4097 RepID=A0A1S3YIK8_TOBAC
RMPAVYSALYRVLSEVRRRLPGFSPAKVLDFGAGTGSAFWALREVWPRSLNRINLVEPSQSMQRAGQSLIKALQIVLLSEYRICQQEEDFVCLELLSCLYEGDSLRFTSRDLRCHILESFAVIRISRPVVKDCFLVSLSLAFFCLQCPHDGSCPLDNTGKYCHFVQRLQRTTSQRAYKRSKGEPLRGFEDEKFCFIAFKRGQRPREPWPLDGMKFETLKEQHARRNPEDLEIDYEDQFISEDEDVQDEDPISYDSDVTETDAITENDDWEEEGEETAHANLGSGWGRIIYNPLRRGKRVEMDICRSMDREGTEGSFDRIVITKSKNPTLHHQARRSVWGDLWPF